MHWYLKKRDGSIYGPVDVESLKRWAEDGRIAPDDEISRDQKKWEAPATLKDLGMIWLVELPDGTNYGPVNPLALREPLQNEEITIFCRVTNEAAKEELTVGEVLLESMLREDGRLRKELQELKEHPPVVAGKKPEAKLNGTTGTEEQPAGASANWKEVLRRKDFLEKEVGKWKKMYEEERADGLKHKEERDEQVREIKSELRSSQDAIAKLHRDIAHLEKKYNLLKDTTTQDADGENSAVSQLATLMDAYNELMRNYDNIELQINSQSEQMQAILDSRELIENETRERIEQMEKRLEREREEADIARRRLREMESTHNELLKSYREMNDRFIRLREQAKPAQ